MANPFSAYCVLGVETADEGYCGSEKQPHFKSHSSGPEAVTRSVFYCLPASPSKVLFTTAESDTAVWKNLPLGGILSTVSLTLSSTASVEQWNEVGS